MVFLQIDSGGCGMLYWQTGRPPLRIPLFKPEGFETALAQLGHRLVGEHAIGSAAVSDDRLVASVGVAADAVMRWQS
jgi:hypothetical protein